MAAPRWLVGLVIVAVATEQPSEVVTHDVEYAKGWVRAPAQHQTSLRLDVYEPGVRRVPRPAVILLHGGGLRVGDKSDANVSGLCRELAGRGFVCISMNYRMIPDQPADAGGGLVPVLDAGVADALAATEWLRANATRYGIDRTRVSIGGSSAGATIALMLAYSPGTEGMFRRAFSWSGTLDGREDIVGAGEPSLFIVHGSADAVVDPSAALALAHQAKRVGVRFELFLCDGLGHAVPMDRRPRGVSLNDRLVRFLQTDSSEGGLSSQSCPR